MRAGLHVSAALACGLGALSVCGCKTAPRRQTTSPPQAVDRQQDNAAIVAQLTPGLLIRIVIRADRLVLPIEPPIVARVLRRPERKLEGDLVEVTGLAHGEPVARVLVPDTRWLAKQGAGASPAPDRELLVSLPLPRRIDTLEIRLPGAQVPVGSAVDAVFDAYCEGRPPHPPFCGPGVVASTPP